MRTTAFLVVAGVASTALVTTVVASPATATNGNGLGRGQAHPGPGAVVQRLSRLPRAPGGTDARWAPHSTRARRRSVAPSMLLERAGISLRPTRSAGSRSRPATSSGAGRSCPACSTTSPASNAGSDEGSTSRAWATTSSTRAHRAAAHAEGRLPPGGRLLLPGAAYDGADFPWLAANVVYAATGKTVLAADVDQGGRRA